MQTWADRPPVRHAPVGHHAFRKTVSSTHRNKCVGLGGDRRPEQVREELGSLTGVCPGLH
eukprot:5186838-Alexandrium_andersonii.AAC.1